MRPFASGFQAARRARRPTPSGSACWRHSGNGRRSTGSRSSPPTSTRRPSPRRARGQYPASISTDVSADRLRRFFQRSEHGYEVGRRLRELCVFATPRPHRATLPSPGWTSQLPQRPDLPSGAAPEAGACASCTTRWCPTASCSSGTSETVGDTPELSRSSTRRTASTPRRTSASAGMFDLDGVMLAGRADRPRWPDSRTPPPGGRTSSSSPIAW